MHHELFVLLVLFEQLPEASLMCMIYILKLDILCLKRSPAFVLTNVLYHRACHNKVS